MRVRTSFLKLSLCGWRLLALPVLGISLSALPMAAAAAAQAERSPIAISITSNTSQIDTFDRLRLQRVGSSQHIELKKTGKLVSRGTSLFTGTLPAGEYKLAMLADTKTKLNLQLTAQSGFIGNFRVHGGGPVDLGRLVITPINLKVLVGRSGRVASNLPLIKAYAPEQAALYEKPAAGGWADARHPDDKVEEYAISKPGDLECITEKDGLILAGGRMGTLMQRQANGQWRGLSGPGIAALNCASAVKLPNAEMLVTGEFGTLLRLAKGENRLQAVSTGNLPVGNLLRVVGSVNSGWYIANLRGDHVTLYYSPTIENGKWSEVRSESVERLPGRQGYRYWIWPTRTGLAYTTGRDAIHSLDVGTRQWSALALPAKQKFSGLAISPTGMMAITGGGKHHVSYDAGKNWEPLKVALPKGFTEAGTVQQMADASIVMMGMSKPHKSALYRSADKGQNWQLVKQFDWPYHVKVLKAVPFLQISDESNFGFLSMSTSSDGTQWRSEYTSYDLEYEEQEKKRQQK
ncbi:hypothetical protein [Pseudoduganella sp. HUAS MS19]